MKTEKKYEFDGYGCPNTEMWTRRHQFEQEMVQASTLDLGIRIDAPHYDSRETRIVYAKWEEKKFGLT